MKKEDKLGDLSMQLSVDALNWCKALRKQGEKWAKENGAVGIRLCSGIEREKAHKFYLSQGYIENKLQKNLKKVF